MKDQSLSGGMFLFRHLEDIIKRHWIFFPYSKKKAREKEIQRRKEEGEGGRDRLPRQYHGIKRNDQIETSIISKC